MASSRTLPTTAEECLVAIKEAGSIELTSRAIGVSTSTIRSRLAKAGIDASTLEPLAAIVFRPGSAKPSSASRSPSPSNSASGT